MKYGNETTTTMANNSLFIGKIVFSDKRTKIFKNEKKKKKKERNISLRLKNLKRKKQVPDGDRMI